MAKTLLDDVDLFLVQVAGEIFVLGEGDCGQLGKGEDVAEAPRPQLSPIPGKQVRLMPTVCSRHALH